MSRINNVFVVSWVEEGTPVAVFTSESAAWAYVRNEASLGWDNLTVTTLPLQRKRKATDENTEEVSSSNGAESNFRLINLNDPVPNLDPFAFLREDHAEEEEPMIGKPLGDAGEGDSSFLVMDEWWKSRLAQREHWLNLLNGLSTSTSTSTREEGSTQNSDEEEDKPFSSFHDWWENQQSYFDELFSRNEEPVADEDEDEDQDDVIEITLEDVKRVAENLVVDVKDSFVAAFEDIKRSK